MREERAQGLYLPTLRAAEARLRQDGADAPSEFYRSLALLKLCRYGQAEEAFRHSIEIDGGLQSAPSPSLANLAWATFDGGEPIKAFDLFQTILQRQPSDTQALYGAGLAAKFMGRREQASSFFKRYLEVAPSADPWRDRVRQNLAELESFRLFRGL